MTKRTLSWPPLRRQKLPEVTMIAELYQELVNGRKGFDGPIGDVNSRLLFV